MSIAQLTLVYDEVRRLSIAGSATAPGDFRLKKLVAPLEQAGQKAPVFAKVALAIVKLVESDEKSAPEAMLDLSTLVNAILYTQGETGTTEKLKPVQTIEFPTQQTQATARVLKPLLEALTNTGSGRLEIIKDAHQRGAFRDLRLVLPALAALDDTYGEIGDWMAENVLPQYGAAILAELRRKFDPRGRAGNVRRLRLIHSLDPKGARDLVKQTLEEGSKEVKVEAIACLGESPEDLQFLLDQAKAKSKEVRGAALKGLGKLGSESAETMLMKALEGEDIAMAVAPIQATSNLKLKKLTLEVVRKQFQGLLTTKIVDKVELGKLTQRMLWLLECLRWRDEKEVDDFVVSLLDSREKIGGLKGDPGGQDIQLRVASIAVSGPKKSREKLIDLHEALSAEELQLAFLAAIEGRSADEVYNLFSPYYRSAVGPKKKGAALAKREALASALTDRPWNGSVGQSEEFLTTKLDPRWLDDAIAVDDLEVVKCLAKPGHQAVNVYLLAAFETRSTGKKHGPYEAEGILSTMIRVGHPQATDCTIKLIENAAKQTYGYYYLGRLIEGLPKEAASRLEALLPGLPDKLVDQILEAITELKNKP